jgi:SHS2 domain-containing protein
VRRWVEHTSEVELEIVAESPAGVFAEAIGALRELLHADEPPSEPAASRTVSAEGPDRPALLAAFIEELVFLAESESLVPLGLRRVELKEGVARAEVEVARADPPHLVKAVTYHRLEFERADGGYRARVVLDV